jgi:hypothetical protein
MSGTLEKPARTAAPADVDRLIRVLSVSGRRLVECDGVWRVLPRGDRRLKPLMTLCAEDLARFKLDGVLVPTANGYVLATENSAEREVSPGAGPWVFEAIGVRASNAGRRGFARLAEMARHGRGALTLRQALAGLRLIEDAEQAARDVLLTMNWDAVPADKNARSGGGRPSSPARRAAKRIECIRAALGERDFNFVYAACVQRVHFKVLESRFGLKRLESRKWLPEALEKVADVYDG